MSIICFAQSWAVSTQIGSENVGIAIPSLQVCAGEVATHDATNNYHYFDGAVSRELPNILFTERSVPICTCLICRISSKIAL